MPHDLPLATPVADTALAEANPQDISRALILLAGACALQFLLIVALALWTA